MQVFVFAGSEGRYAALLKDDPSMLPNEQGPWKPMGKILLNSEEPDRIGLSTEQAIQDLSTLGRHFFQPSKI